MLKFIYLGLVPGMFASGVGGNLKPTDLSAGISFYWNVKFVKGIDLAR